MVRRGTETKINKKKKTIQINTLLKRLLLYWKSTQRGERSKNTIKRFLSRFGQNPKGGEKRTGQTDIYGEIPNNSDDKTR